MEGVDANIAITRRKRHSMCDHDERWHSHESVGGLRSDSKCRISRNVFTLAASRTGRSYHRYRDMNGLIDQRRTVRAMERYLRIYNTLSSQFHPVKRTANRSSYDNLLQVHRRRLSYLESTAEPHSYICCSSSWPHAIRQSRSLVMSHKQVQQNDQFQITCLSCWTFKVGY